MTFLLFFLILVILLWGGILVLVRAYIVLSLEIH